MTTRGNMIPGDSIVTWDGGKTGTVEWADWVSNVWEQYSEPYWRLRIRRPDGTVCYVREDMCMLDKAAGGQ